MSETATVRETTDLVEVECVSGEIVRRRIVVLGTEPRTGSAVGICRWRDSIRSCVAIRWNGRWMFEHGMVGSLDAVRKRFAAMVAKGDYASGDAAILERAAHIQEQWNRQHAAHREASVREAKRISDVAEAERQYLASNKVKTRRESLSVKGADGSDLDLGEGYASIDGCWFIHRPVDNRSGWMISHRPSGYALSRLSTLRMARAFVAGLVRSGITADESPKAILDRCKAVRAEASRFGWISL